MRRIKRREEKEGRREGERIKKEKEEKRVNEKRKRTKLPKS